MRKRADLSLLLHSKASLQFALGRAFLQMHSLHTTSKLSNSQLVKGPNCRMAICILSLWGSLGRAGTKLFGVNDAPWWSVQGYCKHVGPGRSPGSKPTAIRKGMSCKDSGTRCCKGCWKQCIDSALSDYFFWHIHYVGCLAVQWWKNHFSVPACVEFSVVERAN